MEFGTQQVETDAADLFSAPMEHTTGHGGDNEFSQNQTEGGNAWMEDDDDAFFDGDEPVSSHKQSEYFNEQHGAINSDEVNTAADTSADGFQQNESQSPAGAANEFGFQQNDSQLPTGAANEFGFQQNDTQPPTGAANEFGFQQNDIQPPTGAANEFGFQQNDTQLPTGAVNEFGFQQTDSQPPTGTANEFGFQQNDTQPPTGAANEFGFQQNDIQPPTGTVNEFGFQQTDSQPPTGAANEFGFEQSESQSPAGAANEFGFQQSESQSPAGVANEFGFEQSESQSPAGAVNEFGFQQNDTQSPVGAANEFGFQKNDTQSPIGAANEFGFQKNDTQPPTGAGNEFGFEQADSQPPTGAANEFGFQQTDPQPPTGAANEFGFQQTDSQPPTGTANEFGFQQTDPPTCAANEFGFQQDDSHLPNEHVTEYGTVAAMADDGSTFSNLPRTNIPDNEFLPPSKVDLSAEIQLRDDRTPVVLANAPDSAGADDGESYDRTSTGQNLQGDPQTAPGATLGGQDEPERGLAFGEGYTSISPECTMHEEQLAQEHHQTHKESVHQKDKETWSSADSASASPTDASTEQVAKLGMATIVAEEIERSHSPASASQGTPTSMNEQYKGESKAVQQVFNMASERIAQSTFDSVECAPTPPQSETIASLPDAQLNAGESPGSEFELAPDAQLGSGEFPGSEAPDAQLRASEFTGSEAPDAQLRASEFPGSEAPDAQLSASELPGSKLEFAADTRQWQQSPAASTATLGMARFEADIIENTVNLASSERLSGDFPADGEAPIPAAFSQEVVGEESEAVNLVFNEASSETAGSVARMAVGADGLSGPFDQPAPAGGLFDEPVEDSLGQEQEPLPSPPVPSVSPPPPAAADLFAATSGSPVMNSHEAFPSSPPNRRPPPVDTGSPREPSPPPGSRLGIVSPVAVDENGNISPIMTSDQLFSGVEASGTGVFERSPVAKARPREDGPNGREAELPDFYTLESPTGKAQATVEGGGREKRSDSIASEVFNAPVSSAPVFAEFPRDGEDGDPTQNWMDSEVSEFPGHATHGNPDDMRQQYAAELNHQQDGLNQEFPLPQPTQYQQEQYQQEQYQQEQYQQEQNQYGANNEAAWQGQQVPSQADSNEVNLDFGLHHESMASAVQATIPPAPAGIFTPPRERQKDGRPAHALASFGFGGKLVTMLPRPKVLLSGSRRNSFSSMGSTGFAEEQQPVQSRELRQDQVKIFLYKDLVTETSDWPTIAITKFPLPLSHRRAGSEVEEFLKWARQPTAVSFPHEDGDVPGASQLLWHAIELLVKAKGQIQTSPRTANGAAEGTFEAGVIHMLLGAAQGGDLCEDLDPCLATPSAEAHSPEQVREAMVEMERLLLLGECESAVVVAIEHGLWAQALVLAHFVSTSAYRKIVGRFAKETFRNESVSRTLFGLLAGQGLSALGPGYPASSPRSSRSPSGLGLSSGVSLSGRSAPGTPRAASPPAAGAARSRPLPSGAQPVCETWKRSLVGILSNRTPGDAAAICAIGDRLLGEAGAVAAAHLCYLVAGVPVQSPVPSRVVLLGGDHKAEHKSQFMTAASIIRTELWVHARQLSSAHFVSTSFQPFRLMYAMWLADVGLTKEAKLWVDSITEIVKQFGGTSVSSRRSGRSTVAGSSGPFTNHFKRQIKVFRDRLQGASGEPTEQQKSSWWPSLGLRIPLSANGFRRPKPGDAAEAALAPPSTAPPPQEEPGEGAAMPPPPVGYSSGTGKARVMPPPMVDTGAGSAPPIAANQGQNQFNPVPTLPSQGAKPPAMFNPAAPTSGNATEPEEKPTELAPPKSGDGPPPSKEAETAGSEAKRSGEDSKQEKKKSAGKDAKPPTPTRTFKASGGMFSSMRNSLLNMLVPKPENAKTASLGKELEAYYDKEKKRWIFPGETEEEVAPPSAPPTSDPVEPSKASADPTTADPTPNGQGAAPGPKSGPSTGPVYSAGKDILGTRSRYVAFTPFGNGDKPAASPAGGPPPGGMNPLLPPGRPRGMTPPSKGKPFTMFKPMVMTPKEDVKTEPNNTPEESKETVEQSES